MNMILVGFIGVSSLGTPSYAALFRM
jgi:hypothetical protein